MYGYFSADEQIKVLVNPPFDDYLAAGAALKADQNTLAGLVLDTRDAMKENMTRSEWEQVFSKAED